MTVFHINSFSPIITKNESYRVYTTDSAIETNDRYKLGFGWLNIEFLSTRKMSEYASGACFQTMKLRDSIMKFGTRYVTTSQIFSSYKDLHLGRVTLERGTQTVNFL